MRIVSGVHRGRTLVAPKGHSTRPTADRARQALFNVLDHAPWSQGFDGVRVADLFAGSGALGLEALSRGAASCVFVERDGSARQAIADNIATLGLADRLRSLRRTPPASRSLASPPRSTSPFSTRPMPKAWPNRPSPRCWTAGWLADEALAVVEVGARETIRPSGYTLLDERVWGAAKVIFLQRS